MNSAEFRAAIYREPESELCVVNGDELLEHCDDKHLEELYAAYAQTGQQVVNHLPGVDDRWSNNHKRAPPSGGSTTFGSRHDAVVHAMAAAAGAWEAATNVNFRHV